MSIYFTAHRKIFVKEVDAIPNYMTDVHLKSFNFGFPYDKQWHKIVDLLPSASAQSFIASHQAF